MVPGKGVDEAVAAAQAFVAERDDNAFVFVGGGAQERAVKDAAADNPRIRALGVVRDESELDGLRAESGFFVATSLHETFGLSVAEAMAAGMPVVASDIAAHREVLADAGLYFPPGDQAALKDRMAELAESEPATRDLGAKAAERARSAFADETAARGLLQAYAKAMGGTKEGTPHP